LGVAFSVIVLVVALHHVWSTSIQLHLELIVNKYRGAPSQPGIAESLFTSGEYKTSCGDDHPDNPGSPVKRPRMTDEVPYLSKKEHRDNQDPKHTLGVTLHPTQEVVNG